MPQMPLRDLKPQLFVNEYETNSDDTGSEGRSFPSWPILVTPEINGGGRAWILTYHGQMFFISNLNLSIPPLS